MSRGLRANFEIGGSIYPAYLRLMRNTPQKEYPSYLIWIFYREQKIRARVGIITDHGQPAKDKQRRKKKKIKDVLKGRGSLWLSLCFGFDLRYDH